MGWLSVQMLVMMAVQATLHDMTSTDDWPVHHMCPEGEYSWCSYNKANARIELDKYKHGFDAIPQAIVQLLKPTYNRLGSAHTYGYFHVSSSMQSMRV